MMLDSSVVSYLEKINVNKFIVILGEVIVYLEYISIFIRVFCS